MSIISGANFRDRVWIIQHPSGITITFTEYNCEITGYEDNAKDFPVLGSFIYYGGNAYFVKNKASQLGWKVIDKGING